MCESKRSGTPFFFFFFFRHKSTYVIIVWAMWDLDVDPKGQESFYFSEMSIYDD